MTFLAGACRSPCAGGRDRRARREGRRTDRRATVRARRSTCSIPRCRRRARLALGPVGAAARGRHGTPPDRRRSHRPPRGRRDRRVRRPVLGCRCRPARSTSPRTAPSCSRSARSPPARTPPSRRLGRALGDPDLIDVIPYLQEAALPADRALGAEPARHRARRRPQAPGRHARRGEDRARQAAPRHVGLACSTWRCSRSPPTRSSACSAGSTSSSSGRRCRTPTGGGSSSHCSSARLRGWPPRSARWGRRREPLPLGPTVALQFATCYINLTVPSSAGRVALTTRYFQRNGVPVATALSAGFIDTLSQTLIQITIFVHDLLRLRRRPRPLRRHRRAERVGHDRR